MTTMTKKISHLNRDKLNVMSEEVVDNLDEILEHFNVKFHKNGTKYYGPCPIHDGSGEKNPWNLYHTGDIYRGNWKCRSHGCEKIFKKTAIGFVRGLLSRKNGWTCQGDKTVSFDETIAWISNWLNKDFSKIQVDIKQVEKRRFIANIGWLNRPEELDLNIKRNSIRTALNPPSAYFLGRGFSKEILDLYDVGDCTRSGKEMFNRAVVPVYDETYDHIVGCTGRSVFNKCKKCKLFHNPSYAQCPSSEYAYIHAKWRHNKGFKAEHHLFNLWFAKEEITQNHSIVLVESPGNVFRLREAGINNVVATFGTNLSDRQLDKLYKYEIFTVNLLYDNDSAGLDAIQNISKIIDRIFNVNIIKLDSNYNDVGELTPEQIESKIRPQIVTHKGNL